MKSALSGKATLLIAPLLVAALAASISFQSDVLATSGSHGQDHKVNICHRTGSHSHPWEAINVDVAAFDGEGKNDHTQHGDFLYHGPVDKNGHPTKEGNSWCGGDEEDDDREDEHKDKHKDWDKNKDKEEDEDEHEQTQTQTQSQSQTQTVNVTIEDGEVLGYKTPTTLPETGIGAFGIALMAIAGPIGFKLSRFGKGK